MSYEYRVIPAPTKGTKAKGAKTAEERFALTLQETMNSMAADGWQFQRAETLPSEERAGLTGRKTVYHNMLVFRRESRSGLEAFQPRVVTGEATGEALGLHIDMSGPRVAAMPEDIRANLAAMQAVHDTLPRPERVGRAIALRRRTG